MQVITAIVQVNAKLVVILQGMISFLVKKELFALAKNAEVKPDTL